MSEHTKGRLVADDDGYLLDAESRCVAASGSWDEVSGPALMVANTRRLAACWNAFDAQCMTTPMIEALVKIGGVDALSDQAAAAMKARDAAQSDLAAARALLRELVDHAEPMGASLESIEIDLYKWYKRACNHLGACDILGGNSEVTT